MQIETSLNRLETSAKLVWEQFKQYKIWLFVGQMGTGKTTFLKVLLPLLGIEAPVSSPTFSLVNQYDSPAVGPIFHMDLYRVVSIDELEQIGIYDYLENENYVFIEWPDLLLPYFDHFAMPYVKVVINVQDTESRLMEINGYNLFGQND